jgi:hypothetical protein
VLIGADIDSKGFWKTPQGISIVLKGRIELVESVVVEQTDLYGNPKERSLDGAYLVWSSSKRSSLSVSGTAVLSNTPLHTLPYASGSIVSYQGEESFLVIQEINSGFRIGKKVTGYGVGIHQTDDPSIFFANTTALDTKQSFC